MSLQQPCLPFARQKRKHENGDPAQQQQQQQQPTSFADIADMTASDYLSAVVEQASTLPDCFVANNDEQHPQTKSTGKRERKSLNQQQQQQQQQQREHVHVDEHVAIDGSAASLQFLISNRTALLPPPSERHVPLNACWVDQTLADFSQLRFYLEQCRQRGVGGKKATRIPLPLMKDRSGWHVFCVGQAEAQGNVGSYFGDSSEGDNDEDAAQVEDANNKPGAFSSSSATFQSTSSPCWRDHVPATGCEPSVQLVLQMDQVMVRRVLSHLAYYVQEGWSSCSSQRAAWLYALLARLERPIHRDDASMLYNLLKVLTQVRAGMIFPPPSSEGMNSNRADLARVNLLIVVIGIYLEQGDASILL